MRWFAVNIATDTGLFRRMFDFSFPDATGFYVCVYWKVIRLTASCLAGHLNSGQNQRREDSDDRDTDEQFDDREPSS